MYNTFFDQSFCFTLFFKNSPPPFLPPSLLPLFLSLFLWYRVSLHSSSCVSLLSVALHLSGSGSGMACSTGYWVQDLVLAQRALRLLSSPPSPSPLSRASPLIKLFFWSLRQDFTVQFKMALKSQTCLLNLTSTRIIGMYHHVLPKRVLKQILNISSFLLFFSINFIQVG